MAFSNIDPTTPAGNEKKKFGDDRIREFKQQTIDNLMEISNYPAATKSALKTAVWTTSTRPTSTELVDRISGYNTDLGCEEYYDLASTSWKIMGLPTLQQWTTTTRPTSPYIGQMGHCTDLDVFERWNGAWVRVNSHSRGDICMWSGATSDISSKKPGWVLADGRSVTIDGATFTVPDLRDKFIAGAGTIYAVGATGGEAKHTLTINEMPSHNHTMRLDGNGDADATVTPSCSDYGILGWTYACDYTGGSQPHNNLPPYYAMCFLYKL